MKKSFGSLLGLLTLLILLSGCVLSRPYGAVAYQFLYPSGYVRDCYTWDETAPIEGTPYQLRCSERVGFSRRVEDLQVLDESGNLLYEYVGIGSGTMRGEAAENNSVWICSEQWSSAHYNGYRSGDLRSSTLLFVDMRNGEFLFSQVLGKNELYLTSKDTRCYFYDCGTEPEEAFFGLFRRPGQNAQIYYRDIEDWEEKRTVCEFDYVNWPEDMDDEKAVEKCIRFYIQEEQVTAAFTTYEQTEEETNTWEYLEKSSITIPLK